MTKERYMSPSVDIQEELIQGDVLCTSSQAEDYNEQDFWTLTE